MYYYFASTLPLIFFDSAPPMSVDEFAADCERLLLPEDYADARVALGIDEGTVKDKTFSRWQKFDTALRNEVAWLRAHQRQQNPFNVIKGEREFDSEIVHTLLQAEKTGNLMEAEKMLMRLAWQRLDEITTGHLFSLDVILAYGAKLKILERLAAFKTDEGAKELKAIMEQVPQGTKN